MSLSESHSKIASTIVLVLVILACLFWRVGLTLIVILLSISAINETLCNLFERRSTFKFDPLDKFLLQKGYLLAAFIGTLGAWLIIPKATGLRPNDVPYALSIVWFLYSALAFIFLYCLIYFLMFLKYSVRFFRSALHKKDIGSPTILSDARTSIANAKGFILVVSMLSLSLILWYVALFTKDLTIDGDLKLIEARYLVSKNKLSIVSDDRCKFSYEEDGTIRNALIAEGYLFPSKCGYLTENAAAIDLSGGQVFVVPVKHISGDGCYSSAAFVAFAKIETCQDKP